MVDRVGEIAAKLGVSNAQVALAWLLHQPGVTAPIVGALKLHHLDVALEATTSKLDEVGLKALLKLDEAKLKVLEEPFPPHRSWGLSEWGRDGKCERLGASCTRTYGNRSDRVLVELPATGLGWAISTGRFDAVAPVDGWLVASLSNTSRPLAFG